MWRAPIEDDGTLGAWMTGPALPTAMLGHVAVAVEDHVVIAGGFDWDRPVDAVHLGTLDDGWTEVEALPGARFSSAAATTEDRVVVLGGWTGAFADITHDALTTTTCAPETP